MDMSSERIVYDSCIICGRESGEPMDRSVEMRSNYIIGAGQLCQACFQSLIPEIQKSNRRLAEAYLDEQEFQRRKNLNYEY